jgi:hypothetical protein
MDSQNFPMMFIDQTCHAEFTFQFSPTQQHNSPIKDANLKKRRKGHPDGPTPLPSPEKKRTRDSISTEPVPFVLSTSPKPQAISEAGAQDVFGYLNDDPPESVFAGGHGVDPVAEGRKSRENGRDDLKTRKDDLRAYWKKETIEEKEDRHYREWEELQRTHEARVFQDEQDKMRRRDKIRADNRARAQRHRDIVRENKIESGWVPFQKRVSSKVCCHVCWIGTYN